MNALSASSTRRRALVSASRLAIQRACNTASTGNPSRSNGQNNSSAPPGNSLLLRQPADRQQRLPATALLRVHDQRAAPPRGSARFACRIRSVSSGSYAARPVRRPPRRAPAERQCSSSSGSGDAAARRPTQQPLQLARARPPRRHAPPRAAASAPPRPPAPPASAAGIGTARRRRTAPPRAGAPDPPPPARPRRSAPDARRAAAPPDRPRARTSAARAGATRALAGTRATPRADCRALVKQRLVLRRRSAPPDRRGSPATVRSRPRPRTPAAPAARSHSRCCATDMNGYETVSSRYSAARSGPLPTRTF